MLYRGTSLAASLEAISIFPSKLSNYHRKTVKDLSPDNIDSPGSDFGVTAHDRDAGGEGAIDAEDHALHSSGEHRQVADGTALVTPVDKETQQRVEKVGAAPTITIEAHLCERPQWKSVGPHYVDALLMGSCNPPF